MYALSRALYKDISPFIADEAVNPSHGSNREQILKACEETIERISDDWRYFHNPERFLFEQIRQFFPITNQLQVFNLISRHVTLAVDVAKTYAARGYKPNGTRLSCRATTRRSTPCMRNIVPGTEYCPSHQHLAEPHFGQPRRSVASSGQTRAA